MKKMNNKGFSLVELIVVVLIMAIIAVALAPQVMKWVENSRLSTDCETYDQMISNLQIALTDKNLGASVTESQYWITNSGTALQTGGDADISTALEKVNSSWADAKSKVSDATYKIKITADKQIERLQAPDTSSNADLD